jgi:hypothetical protein
MSGRALIDSNVLVHAFDPASRDKPAPSPTAGQARLEVERMVATTASGS